MNFIRIKNFFENLTFSQKTTILNIIIAMGMLSIILFSQLSLYILKSDFDTLFEKRTKTIIQLIHIKDTYKINIYDTLKNLHNNNLTFGQAQNVLLLGQYLIKQKWDKYNALSFENSDLSLILQYIKQKFSFHLSKQDAFRKNIIDNINQRQVVINNSIDDMLVFFKTNDTEKNKQNIQNLYLHINSIDISLSNLSSYDMNLALEEKNITQSMFDTITIVLNICLVMIFVVSCILTFGLLRYFGKLNLHLENTIASKTSELVNINNDLESKIKTEVENSRKKDLVIYQQAKLSSLGEMLNNIAHQWRQPLGSLLIIIQSIQSKMELGKLTLPVVEEKVSDAMLLINNMSNTLEDFQNFFHPNKDRALFVMSECIYHSLELSKYSLSKEKIDVHLNIKEDAKLHSYKNELSHVLLNIIANSKDALDDKKKNKQITITTHISDNTAIIECSDNGGGIQDDILPKIFEPYFTTKYKSAGTGIGLYMSKQIVEKHILGSLECENIITSKNKKKGVKFIITIPI